MATITNYNNEQFSQVSNKQLAGVSLIYHSTRRDGTESTTCTHFGGDEFLPQNATQKEVFRVWKNVIKLHWDAKRVETGLRVDNGGIKTKLRATNPAEIVVRLADGRVVFRWTREESIFARIGLMPTPKDLQELVRDYKKKMHKAAKASFDALKHKFAFEAAETEEMPTEDVATNSEAA